MINLFSIIGNFSLRPKWQVGVKNIDEISHPIYHVGIRFRCDFEKGSKFFYSSSFNESGDTFSLTETDEVKTGETTISLTALTKNKTAITLDYYVPKNSIKKMLFSLFAKKERERAFRKSLENLEALCKEQKALKNQ
jgi:hypothetical protein